MSKAEETLKEFAANSHRRLQIRAEIEALESEYFALENRIRELYSNSSKEEIEALNTAHEKAKANG